MVQTNSKANDSAASATELDELKLQLLTAQCLISAKDKEMQTLRQRMAESGQVENTDSSSHVKELEAQVLSLHQELTLVRQQQQQQGSVHSQQQPQRQHGGGDDCGATSVAEARVDTRKATERHDHQAETSGETQRQGQGSALALNDAHGVTLTHLAERIEQFKSTLDTMPRALEEMLTSRSTAFQNNVSQQSQRSVYSTMQIRPDGHSHTHTHNHPSDWMRPYPDVAPGHGSTGIYATTANNSNTWPHSMGKGWPEGPHGPRGSMPGPGWGSSQGQLGPGVSLDHQHMGQVNGGMQASGAWAWVQAADQPPPHSTQPSMQRRMAPQGGMAPAQPDVRGAATQPLSVLSQLDTRKQFPPQQVLSALRRSHVVHVSGGKSLEVTGGALLLSGLLTPLARSTLDLAPGSVQAWNRDARDLEMPLVVARPEGGLFLGARSRVVIPLLEFLEEVWALVVGQHVWRHKQCDGTCSQAAMTPRTGTSNPHTRNLLASRPTQQPHPPGGSAPDKSTTELAAAASTGVENASNASTSSHQNPQVHMHCAGAQPQGQLETKLTASQPWTQAEEEALAALMAAQEELLLRRVLPEDMPYLDRLATRLRVEQLVFGSSLPCWCWLARLAVDGAQPGPVNSCLHGKQDANRQGHAAYGSHEGQCWLERLAAEGVGRAWGEQDMLNAAARFTHAPQAYSAHGMHGVSPRHAWPATLPQRGAGDGVPRGAGAGQDAYASGMGFDSQTKRLWSMEGAGVVNQAGAVSRGPWEQEHRDVGQGNSSQRGGEGMLGWPPRDDGMLNMYVAMARLRSQDGGA